MTWGFVGALGGTRTPNLLIRRDLRLTRGSGHLQSDLRVHTRCCATVVNVARCEAAKIRPRQEAIARIGGGPSIAGAMPWRQQC